jgi:hypothetical protein
MTREEYKEWLVHGEENQPDDGLGDAEPDEPSEDEPEV